MKLSKPFLWVYLGLVVIAFGLVACQTTYALHGTPIDPPKAAPDFTLPDDHGQPFQLGAERGKVVLVYFGYTHCPDVCPLTLANLAQVRQALGPEASQVQVVFVTTDPERDTAAVLEDYLGRFDPSFVGLRGNWAEITPVLQNYYAAAIKSQGASSTTNYSVDHTAYIYAIDRQQHWRALYPQDTSVGDIVSDIRQLLQEKS
jgi:protein SCO1/2